MFRPMKPETIERRRLARIEQMKQNKESLILRLKEKASAEGPDSIWVEMLKEHEQQL